MTHYSTGCDQSEVATGLDYNRYDDIAQYSYGTKDVINEF
jgi:hypothetical protein